MRWVATSWDSKVSRESLVPDRSYLKGGGGSADSIPEFLDLEKDISERRMVCEYFDLARTVEENVILYACYSSVHSIPRSRLKIKPPGSLS